MTQNVTLRYSHMGQFDEGRHETAFNSTHRFPSDRRQTSDFRFRWKMFSKNAVMISNQITNQNKWGRIMLRKKTRLSEEFSQRHFSTKSHAAYAATQKTSPPCVPRPNNQQPRPNNQQTYVILPYKSEKSSHQFCKLSRMIQYNCPYYSFTT
jgi:hypothetical protein